MKDTDAGKNLGSQREDVEPNVRGYEAISRRSFIRRTVTAWAASQFWPSSARSEQNTQGIYFAKTKYVPMPLPVFDETRDKLPAPVFEQDPVYVECYWKAWELAFKNFHEPTPASGHVSQFIDAAFNQNIFFWDTCFLTMFCNYAHPYIPGICSLDNFYAKQHPDGEICREINRTTGSDFGPWVNVEGDPLFSRWGYDWEKGAKRVNVLYKGRTPPAPNPKLTLDALNHPIPAWAERESYHLTGDKARLCLVWDPLMHYYEALKKYLRQGNGLYMTDSASMDNSPRNAWLEGGGTAVDTSSEMVLFARNLAEIGGIIGKQSQAARFAREAAELSDLISTKMWDRDNEFYFDLTLDGGRVPVKSIAGFWTLLAGVPSASQARALVEELNNPRTFKTLHRVPTLAANQEGFGPETGRYWRGAVWAPTNTMVIRGLERYGYHDVAREIALNHLDAVVKVYKRTGTIWENYAPQNLAPGRPAKADFVGWSGLAPIAYLIEYAIGIKADATTNTIAWELTSPKRVGVEKLWFGGKTASLLCEPSDTEGQRTVRVSSDGAFLLKVRVGGKTKTMDVPAGQPVEMSI